MLGLVALGEHWQGVEGTSENSVKAKFAEFLFHDVREYSELLSARERMGLPKKRL
jgi:hypothetical protein